MSKEENKPGGSVTQQDLARLVGVSYPTVNRALSGHASVSLEMRRRVQNAADRLGYRKNYAARSLVTKTTCSVGMIGSHNPPSFWSAVLAAMEQQCRELGYHVIVSHRPDSTSDSYTELEFLTERGVDGVVVAPDSAFERADVLNSYAASGRPLLLLGRYMPGVRASYVGTASQEGARKACQHLIALGHRRIAIVAGLDGDYPNDCRVAGYRAAMEDAGVTASQQMVIRTKGFDEKHGKMAVEQMLALPKRPTAVFCVNDSLAIGMYLGLRERGLGVPEDFSLIGYAGVPEGEYLASPLTTVVQPVEQLGKRAGEVIVDMINGKLERPLFEELTDTLLIRQSCAALKDAEKK